MGETADDFLWPDVLFPQDSEIHAEVAFAEALAVFIHKQRMMAEAWLGETQGDPPTLRASVEQGTALPSLGDRATFSGSSKPTRSPFRGRT